MNNKQKDDAATTAYLRGFECGQEAAKARIAELEKTVSFEGEHNAELRDALEAQARRIAELENELAGWHKSQSRHYDKLHARIAELEALVKELADELQVYICDKYVGRKGCPKSKRDEYDAAAEPVRKARDAISVNNQVKFDSSLDSADLRAARNALENTK
jgi:septal ring factor EnvC (AmiA/AmiB activator)